MGRLRYSRDEIIDLLSGVERRLSQGESLDSACKSVGISQSSYRRWRKRYDAALPGGSTGQDSYNAHWNKVFWPTFVVIFLITLIYPVTMILTLHSDAFRYMRHDVAWSLHSVFLIPIAFALLATAFNPDLLNNKIVWLLPFIIVLPLLIGAVIKDTQVIPTPDRVSSANGLRKNAMDIDACLRRSNTCDHYISDTFLNSCYEKYSHHPTIALEGVTDKTERKSFLDNFKIAHGYLCALLEKSNGKVETGFIATVIVGLKIILIIFVWSFIYYTIFLAFNWFDYVDKRILYTLISCFVILVTWFPFQLYAEWHQWYGDLSHVWLFGSFAILFGVAVLLLLLFTFWTFVIVGKADIGASIAGVYSALVLIVGFIVKFNPESVNSIFLRVENIDVYTFSILGIIFLLYLLVMVKLLVKYAYDKEANR